MVLARTRGRVELEWKRKGERVMRSLRLLGLPLASTIKTIIPCKVKPRQFHLYHSSKPCSSCSYLSLGKDSTAIAGALSLAETSNSCFLGLQIHARIIKLGLTSDIFSLNNLIKTYSKCGQLGHALKVFDEMPERNLVSWTLLVTAAVQDGEFELGLEVYSELVTTGLRPNEFSVASVLKACASTEAYKFGISVHSCALKLGIEQNRFVASSLLNMYAELEDVESAEGVFESTTDLDTACWNTMIGGYTKCGYGFESWKLVSLMVCKGLCMDHFTFVNALKGCSSMGNLDFGKQLHGLLIRSDMEFSTSVMNALTDMYSTHGKKDLAFKVFNRIKTKDIISWNTAFGVFSDDINAKELLNLVHEFMLANMKPNHVTFSVLFRQCGQLLDLNLGHQFFCLALQFGVCNEAIVRSSLMNMFSRCGAVEMAFLFFDSLLYKSITSWNELISGCNSNYYYVEAMKSFYNLWHLGVGVNEFTLSIILETCFRDEHQQMVRQIHGAIVKSGYSLHGYVCSSLIKCYVKLGQLDESFEFFNGFESLDVEIWGTMISALVHQGYHFQAIKFLNSLMEAGRKPDEFILGSILSSCAHIAGYHLTHSVHSIVIKMGFQKQVFVVSAVIDAYAKCGDIENARMIFSQSSKSGDVVICNAMIIACAHHGLVEEAMAIFEKMKLANLKPSQATFVSVLAACSHMGRVDQGRLLFESIASDHKLEQISQDIYGCMVDLLSRNGFLEEARQIIEVMPYTPWPAILRSLLSGCRTHGNLQLGEWAVKELVQLVPENDAPYVLLSKAHSEAGSWEDATKIRREMIERGVQKNTGYSWIEL
ncbi:pentatricopeptide repeat-containing protein At3g09040, mitochondrial-like [Rosa rugosa]|uniref:pentatricopeptide repeat-containing protein At3g09040, mitochondrial-like n=1 Tax=Rosa rugosa TaxID=74645 RepID=UPI002B40C6F2|nr:pentatricopeptide repeat-containing protein At3g09040, mitochondrial-like [Rosa rugosa]XP_062024717.1 pentatricopeptide repeat-containing protein At3g09040, mitochondrial-like [Rosa rugosa]XP_062024718.1 pentatricopeptide repeat-containing protein At3g09040, mitochondrial-like [Rosa rugosa]XP_062024719.1 pentatricopeptide repeat-containing protein At3g09040, mitochondrial-like [Rosa rugosa]XP_062024720.1 pentatricopeptide repeat-containing protein At3g09040, mitochondrial-like [Rosa rugosa]